MSHGFTLKKIYARCELDEDRCWLWKGGKTKDGKYPITQVPDSTRPHGQRQVHVRRVVFELANGRPAGPPPRYVLVVKCGKERCVTAGCIQEQTKGERLRQTAATGIFTTLVHRAKTEEGRRRRSKLSDERLGTLRARAAANEPVEALAAEYGLSVGYTYAVLRGEHRVDFSSPMAALIPPTVRLPR